MNSLWSTMWPGALVYTHFIFLAYAPEKICMPHGIYVPLHCYCSLHIDPTLLLISVNKQKLLHLLGYYLCLNTYWKTLGVLKTKKPDEAASVWKPAKACHVKIIIFLCFQHSQSLPIKTVTFFYLSCYCHICARNKYAPFMQNICQMCKLLDMHQQEKFAFIPRMHSLVSTMWPWLPYADNGDAGQDNITAQLH